MLGLFQLSVFRNYYCCEDQFLYFIVVDFPYDCQLKNEQYLTCYGSFIPDIYAVIILEIYCTVFC